MADAIMALAVLLVVVAIFAAPLIDIIRALKGKP